MMKLNQSDEMVSAWDDSGLQVALAKGVLVQAKRDLRRFREAPDRIGRGMYETPTAGSNPTTSPGPIPS